MDKTFLWLLLGAKHEKSHQWVLYGIVSRNKFENQLYLKKNIKCLCESSM